MEGLGQIALARGDFAGARRSMQEALAIRSEMGDGLGAASSRADLAMLAIEDSRPRDAEAPLRESIEAFRKAKSGDDEAAAEAALARSMAAQGRPLEAQAAVRRAKGLLSAGSALPIRFEIALAEAYIEGGPVGLADRRQRLTAVLGEAMNHGYTGYAYRIRLALCELEVRSGSAAEGRACLVALGNEAAAKGFDLIARKARIVKPAPG